MSNAPRREETISRMFVCLPRRGSMLYMTAVLFGIAVVGGAVTLLSVQADRRRIQQNIGTSEQARLNARTAAEWGLMVGEWYYPNWRDLSASYDPYVVSLGSLGQFTLTVADTDADFADDDTDPVTYTLVGESGGATHTSIVEATPYPHRALGYAVVAATDIIFDPNVTVRGPLYADRYIYTSNGSTVVTTEDDGRYEVPSGGWIDSDVGTGNEDADPLTAPTADLSFYLAKATALSPTSALSTFEIRSQNFTPTFNSQGSANPEGIYSIDARSYSDVRIRDVHVEGTLIIRTNNADIVIDDRAWIEPGPSGYPSLLIEAGSGRIDFDFDGTSLVEANDNIDFNEDGDMDDSFRHGVEGIAWIDTQLTSFRGTAWTFKGCLITDTLHVLDGVTLDNDPIVADQLVHSFTDGLLHVIPGSWR